MQHIFHHNSSGNSAFTNDLLSREVLRAISLHPVKQFKYQYRLHNFINQRKIIDLKQKSFLLNLHLNLTKFVKQLAVNVDKIMILIFLRVVFLQVLIYHRNEVSKVTGVILF